MHKEPPRLLDLTPSQVAILASVTGGFCSLCRAPFLPVSDDSAKITCNLVLNDLSAVDLANLGWAYMITPTFEAALLKAVFLSETFGGVFGRLSPARFTLCTQKIEELPLGVLAVHPACASLLLAHLDLLPYDLSRDPELHIFEATPALTSSRFQIPVGCAKRAILLPNALFSLPSESYALIFVHLLAPSSRSRANTSTEADLKRAVKSFLALSLLSRGARRFFLSSPEYQLACMHLVHSKPKDTSSHYSFLDVARFYPSLINHLDQLSPSPRPPSPLDATKDWHLYLSKSLSHPSKSALNRSQVYKNRRRISRLFEVERAKVPLTDAIRKELEDTQANTAFMGTMELDAVVMQQVRQDPRLGGQKMTLSPNRNVSTEGQLANQWHRSAIRDFLGPNTEDLSSRAMAKLRAKERKEDYVYPWELPTIDYSRKIVLNRLN